MSMSLYMMLIQSNPEVTLGEMASGRLIGIGCLNGVLSEIGIRRGINVTLSEYNMLNTTRQDDNKHV